jgi:hypothetical protein
MVVIAEEVKQARQGMLEQRDVTRFLVKEASDRRKSLVAEKMSTTRLRRRKFKFSFGWGKFGEGEKNLPMKRGPEDHRPPVSMKFSLIAAHNSYF